ncbi:hypothetical protein QBC34DRAFT_454954 [Podospora aff. communis PSN243]|uniref:SnoaL-like domain-containing protein n=1 Tax=Podospora aff. communis PSN243 TaxID=3040156 RepID=A0AAV9G1B8_9PEZI|nr:hypothetical protein QBC34DRAFT_454954 [Podospora aff. communis PSN243]
MSSTTTISFLSSILTAFSSFISTSGTDFSAINTAIDDAYDPNIVFHFVGQPGKFALAYEGKGTDALKEFFATVAGPVLVGVLDTTQNVEHEVVRALTGGEGEGVLEFKQKGVGRDGKPWLLEALIVFKAGESGKITEATVYCDTLYLQERFGK